METVIVAIIVALAVAWAGWRLVARRRAGAAGCAAGCGGCSCAAKPQPVNLESLRLVPLKRRR